MKKRLLILLLITVTGSVFAQKHEITTLAGIAFYHGNSFQCKFSTPLIRELELQTGLRYNNNINWDYLSEPEQNSIMIKDGYVKNLLDISLRYLPFKGERFDLYIGGGFTTGKITYYASRQGEFFQEPQLNPSDEKITKVMMNYNLIDDFTYGYHFFIQPNFSLNQNMFLSAQVLYSQLANKNYENMGIYIEGTINLSLGVGYRF
ncbi:MAG: hypothetical protein K9G70_07745 [Prolixibacteraceae bacterium]|nr:hypothetical protein [Prolixibacteraceae bacterium]